MKVQVESEEGKYTLEGSANEILQLMVEVICVDKKQEELKVKHKKQIKKISPKIIEVAGQRIGLGEYKAGKDYFVCLENGKHKISKEECGEVIGGFHYGLIGEDFEAINNISKKNAKKIKGINAYSIWDNTHRPICNPKGMVYVPKLDIWVDIYLCNNEYEKHGTSKAGQSILAGSEYNGRKLPNEKKEFGYLDFKEVGEKNGKRMLTEQEFQIAMLGVKENASAYDLDDGTTKHIADFTSKYGIEQATGVQWVWSADNYKDYDDRAVVLGGFRGDGVYAGSRASNWIYCVWNTYWVIGSRFACDSLKPVK